MVESRQKLDVRTFDGMIDSFDPEDIPPGNSDIQINMVCTVWGEMSTRRGYKICQFEPEA